MDYFIMVSGVNIYENAYDTDQLSVIRGTSFIYKDAIKAALEVAKIQAEKMQGIEFTEIRVGGSVGVFSLKKADQKQVDTIIAAMKRELLNPNKNWKYVPFILEKTQSDGYLKALDILSNQTAISQYNNATIPLESLEEKYACQWHGARVGKRQNFGDEEKKLNPSVFARFQYGRDKKKNYYINSFKESGLTDEDTEELERDYTFANSIEDICKPSKTFEGTSLEKKFANKMAVIYADGNGFGSMQRAFLAKAASPIDAQRKFDRSIINQRNTFLKEMVLNGKKLSENEGDNAIQLETLLWGGDECMFILPAWRAFKVVNEFLNYNWNVPSRDGTKPLTHAVGLVICHEKTPIRIIKNYAEALANRIKNAKGGRANNGWDYLVLESIDYPTGNLDDFFATRYPGALAANRPCGLTPISPNDMQKLQQAIINENISKRQLYNVVRSYFDNPADCQNAVTKAVERMQQVSANKEWTKQNFEDLTRVFKGLLEESDDQQNDVYHLLWFCLHLIELWEYLCPVAIAEAEKNSDTQEVA